LITGTESKCIFDSTKAFPRSPIDSISDIDDCLDDKREDY